MSLKGKVLIRLSVIAAVGILLIPMPGYCSEKPYPQHPAVHGAEEAPKPNGQPQQETKQGEPPTPLAQPKPSAQSATDDGTKTQSAQNKQDSPKWTDIINAVSAVVMAIFTAALTGVAFKQISLAKKLASDTADSIAIARMSAEAAAKSAHTAERALILTQRGEITYSSLTGSSVLDDHGTVLGWGITFNFKNIGRTQATHLKLAYNTSVFPGEMPADFDISPNIVLEGQPERVVSSEANFATLPTGFKLDVLKDAMVGRCQIYMYGTVQYKDVFTTEHTHRLDYCYRLHVTRDPDERSAQGRDPPFVLQMADRGNSAI